MSEYKVDYDADSEAIYIDLTPHRTKYEGVSKRQLEIDLREHSSLLGGHSLMILDFDANGRVLGIELL